MTKKNLIPLLLLSIPTIVMAQNEKLTKHRLSDNLSEQYTVSANDAKQKEGLYTIYNDQNKLILRGAYKDGQKVGKWRFFDPEQHLTQIFDYTDKKLYFSNADSASYVTTDVYVTDDLTADVKAPVKIGGATFTFLMLYSPKSIPQNITKAKQDIQLNYVFDVSETGKTEKVMVTYIAGNIEEKRKVTLRNPELFDFVPAMVNGKPSKSQVTLNSTIYIDKIRTLGNNSVVTQ